MDESAVLVTFDESGMTSTRPDGLVEAVPWAELRAVLIETNDSGPWGSDVFWILLGQKGGAVVPMGATGERELLLRLQMLEGFDNEAVIAAMGSTDNARFLCWERPERPGKE